MTMTVWGKSRHYEWRKIEARHGLTIASGRSMAGSTDGRLDDPPIRLGERLFRPADHPGESPGA